MKAGLPGISFGLVLEATELKANIDSKDNKFERYK